MVGMNHLVEVVVGGVLMGVLIMGFFFTSLLIMSERLDAFVDAIIDRIRRR